MPDRLTAEGRDELTRLASRYGRPVRVRARLHGADFDPITRSDRFGEVALVIRRPSGSILLSTKDFYPPGAFRIPTGGISHGERIRDALLREAHEETGLDVEIERFLAWIDYEADRGSAAADPPPTLFHTFAFLLGERGGTLGSLDPAERILAYEEIPPGEPRSVADRLEAVTSRPSAELGGDWADWGAFRAVVHRAVADALAHEGEQVR